ncbi:MAG: hypothetical protein U0Y68_17640 [Blastocatellia bacterium]
MRSARWGGENSLLKRVVAYVANETKSLSPPKDNGALAWLKGLLPVKRASTIQRLNLPSPRCTNLSKAISRRFRVISPS